MIENIEHFPAELMSLSSLIFVRLMSETSELLKPVRLSRYDPSCRSDKSSLPFTKATGKII